MSPEAPYQAPKIRTADLSAPGGILKIVLLYASFASLWILLSDKIVEWLFPNPVHLSLANTLKGWAFVAVTSILLYGRMRRLLQQTGRAHVVVPGLRPLVLPLGVLSLVIISITGGGIAHNVLQHKKKEVARVQAIVDLKTQQIEDWLAERYGDARFVQTNRQWAILYANWRDQGDTASRDLLQWRLKEFAANSSFQSAFVLDEQTSPVWSTEDEPFSIDPALGKAAWQAAQDNDVGCFGPYRDPNDRLRLDFIAPLPAVDDRPAPIIVLRVNPTSQLFRILETWPMPGARSEILLFRRDGGQVLYPNELRHSPAAAVKLRLPLREKNWPAAQILRNETREGNLVEGEDERGLPVMTVVRAIYGTDWFLAANVDRAWLYRETAGDVLWIALAGLLALFMAATGVYIFLQRQELATSLWEREMQTEKLRTMQLLDAIAEGSTDAIFAKDGEGCYLLFNREAARVTGKEPHEVIGRDDREVFPAGQAALIMVNDRKVMRENRSVTFQEELTTADGEISFMATKGPLHDNSGNVIGMFGISRDITRLKRAERERELTVDFLRLVNGCGNKEEMIRAAASFFHERSGCQAVGIRLKHEDDYPYYEARGFPPRFILEENSLCARDVVGEVVRDDIGNPVLACMCGNVIQGRFDPSKPFFSNNGSFWTNCTTELLATTTEADRQARTRNRCHGEGFESVALIPLSVGDNRFGLLQLNDRRQGRFSPDDIALWERLAGYLAVAMAKFHAEGLRRESEELLRAIIDNAESIIWFKDLEGHFLIVNRYCEHIMERPLEELLGRTVFDLFPRDTAENYTDNDRRVIEAGEPMEVEELASLKDGLHTYLSVKFPVRDPGGVIYGLGAICTDITERKRAEEALRESLEEKVALLKEVHHRVKNNLQIVVSLLSLQASRMSSPEAVEALRDTQNRVRSMALLHELLYHSGNLARINFAVYVRELCTQLMRSAGPAAARVRVESHVASLGLALEQAVPCGLIISELVSNALKHGFPEDRCGRVVVELQPDDAQQLVLCVSDDGVGLPSGLEPAETSTLGLKLASNLAGQLGGQLERVRLSDGGAAFRVTFPVPRDNSTLR